MILVEAAALYYFYVLSMNAALLSIADGRLLLCFLTKKDLIFFKKNIRF
ncbi:hypothetical protein D934_00510 [Xylella fastidiosa subsp. sandyi Ann-1]|uniref:Uncharacterized protein n=1 Tax=Xylella fastidiosa subsp. sandyi Ann-1 TaxID=155920 RepID=A0A060HC44_XYLFS|nr:hypothetical protein D934_00510 [Xylella fastidiosa subsp. sandyi Ann-1]AIC14148.1 hypothetical protein P303_12200 [Xylella fastidiosa MUL0034]